MFNRKTQTSISRKKQTGIEYLLGKKVASAAFVKLLDCVKNKQGEFKDLDLKTRSLIGEFLVNLIDKIEEAKKHSSIETVWGSVEAPKLDDFVLVKPIINKQLAHNAMSVDQPRIASFLDDLAKSDLSSDNVIEIYNGSGLTLQHLEACNTAIAQNKGKGSFDINRQTVMAGFLNKLIIIVQHEEEKEDEYAGEPISYRQMFEAIGILVSGLRSSDIDTSDLPKLIIGKQWSSDKLQSVFESLYKSEHLVTLAVTYNEDRTCQRNWLTKELNVYKQIVQNLKKDLKQQEIWNHQTSSTLTKLVGILTKDGGVPISRLTETLTKDEAALIIGNNDDTYNDHG